MEGQNINTVIMDEQYIQQQYHKRYFYFYVAKLVD